MRLILNTGHPMYVFWGEAGACLYNDAYRRSIGPERHPCSLGRPAREVWAEIWDAIGPQIAQMMAGRGATWHENQLLPITRNGRREEVYWTYSYGPIDDEAAPTGVGGVLVVCTETTATVLAERRQRFLADLEAALRPIPDPRAVTAAAAGLLGRYLGASRVGFGEVDAAGEHFTVEQEHRASVEVPAAVGRHRLDDFGSELAADLRAGRTAVVTDVEADPRTAASAGAHLALGARSIVAVPLLRGEHLRATLHPNRSDRRPWTAHEVALAEQVAARVLGVVEEARAVAARRASEERYRILFDSIDAGFCVVEAKLDGAGRCLDYSILEANPAFGRLTGLVDAAGRWVRAELAPDLEEHWFETYGRVARTGEPVRFENRAGPLGDRWFEVYAYRTEPGRFAALFLNVTERKAAEERQALLAREVDHRAKNTLAVVQAVLRLTRAPDLEGYARVVQGRVGALARAHAALADDRWAGADLRALLAGELAPFAGGGPGQGPRAELDGPSLTLPAGAAQPLAMVVHELATNAVKHGALSAPAGRLAVSWSVAGPRPGGGGRPPPPLLRLRWVETGGPTVAGAPRRRGVGSQVLDGVVRGQLGGRATLAWEASGLVCELEVPLGSAADGADAGGALPGAA